MTSPSEDRFGLSQAGRWHIIDPDASGNYLNRDVSLCGEWLYRKDGPVPPLRIAKIMRGMRKSTGTCKTCLRSAGRKAVTVELPKPTVTKAATDDENGYSSWKYPDGEVIVYDDGTIEYGGRHYGSPSLIRKQAAAMLAAAEVAEKLIGRAE